VKSLLGMDKNYISAQKENKLLIDKINTHMFSENQDKQDVDEEKTKYLKETILYMRFFNNCLFGIYLMLFAGSTYLLINKPLDNRAKIALILLFLLYPFFISGLQDNLRFIYNFLFSATTNINTTSIPESNEAVNNKTTVSIQDSDERLVKYHTVSKENSILETKVTNNANESLMNSRNSVFTASKSDYYKDLNGYLFILYYLSALGFIYVLFATNAFPIGIYFKMGVVILLAGYPYYIDILVGGLIYLVTILYKLVMGQPYKDSNAKYDTVVF